MKEIVWKAAEYEYVRKDVSWYWIIGIVVAVLVLVALWQKNFFFAVFVLTAGAVFMFFGKRRPQTLEFRINEKGVAIGDRIFYDYDHLQGFVMRSRPRRLDEIVLKRKTTVSPYVKVPIDSKLALGAKELLSKHLPEIEYEDSLIDIVSEWLGF